MTHSRWLLRTLYIGVVLASIPVFISPLQFLADDALFYPQVAYNIVRTGNSTFNSVTLTNGYHPLWMVVNVVAMTIARAHRITGLYITLAIELGLLLVSVYAYRRWFGQMGLQRSVLGVGVIIGVICSSFWGMESHLTILFVILCGWQFVRLDEQPSNGSWVVFGMLLGALILSRLDDVFVALALIVSGAFDRRTRVYVQRLLLAGVPCCMLVVPYLLFNKATFGHPMPISGAIKSCFPHVSGNLYNIGSLGELSAVFAIGGIALTLLSSAPARVLRLVRALCFGVLAQLAYTLFFTNDQSTASFWYYATATLNCALILDLLVDTLLSRLSLHKFIRIFQGSIVACSVLIAVAGITRSWLKLSGININPMNPTLVQRVLYGSNERFEQQLAHWMKTNLPPHARLLTVDFPGRIAFLTDVAVVPLDGLMSDYRYNDEIVQKGIGEFISRTDMDYYIGPICEPGSSRWYSYYSRTVSSPEGGQQIEIVSPLYRVSAGSFHLEKGDLLLDINQAFVTTNGLGHLGVWKLKRSSGPATK
jgi:hypothetical protein